VAGSPFALGDAHISASAGQPAATSPARKVSAVELASRELPEPGTIESRIVDHLQFARAVASRSIDPRCRGADREDLISWGLVGLVQAAHRYRGDRGASFGAYAARRVRGQILDALRERDPLTRSARRAFRAEQRASEDRGAPASVPNPPYVEVSLDRIGDVAEVHRAVDTATSAGPSSRARFATSRLSSVASSCCRTDAD
jgi:RNA polymerase sigma factor (sigma-70 family)